MNRKKGTYCVYCNCDTALMLTKDHIVPKSLGGTDSKDNLQVVCWVCNQLKGSLTHTQFLNYRKALKILFELKKIKFNFPSNLNIIFSQEHYPNFKHKVPIKEEKQNDI